MSLYRDFLLKILPTFPIFFLVLIGGFAYFEPTVVRSITDEHTVKQTITEEIVFSTAPTDVIMSPSLASITGGSSNGGTQFVIVSTNSTGFSVTISSDSDNGMEAESSSSYIPYLIEDVPGVPDYSFGSAPANSAAFAYAVNASTTSDLDSSFLHGDIPGIGTCGDGGSNKNFSTTCWIGATTTPYTIINRSTATPASGSTSTIHYRLHISANPIPLIPEDTYTSTTTLTATNN